MTWYEEFIEPEIRSIVKLLRDNGINTECSCGHKMWVQFQVIDNEPQIVDKILCNSGYKNYLIECHYERHDNWPLNTATVYFPVNGVYPIQTELTAAKEQLYLRKSE
jgi:hypothetical protein